MLDVLSDAMLDILKLAPFLFVAFLFLEAIEHKMSDKSKKIIKKSGKFGPFIGSLLGLFPNCGFSTLATNLYITGVVSMGTLVSIYLSTSDEMLPLLIAEKVSIKIILITLLIKFICGVIFGILIDLFNKNKNINLDYHICSDDDCDCEHGIFKSALIHTLKILTFIFFVTLILNILFEYFNLERIFIYYLKDSFATPFIMSLLGLIPNCGASVIITELYLKEVISYSSMIGGLLTGSGVALLVLFRSNKNMKDNFKIISLIYLIGVFVGCILKLFGI